MLQRAMGLMFVSSLVRGLSALAAVILAATEGTGEGMDQYMALMTVVPALCAAVASPFATLVARQLSHPSVEGAEPPADRCRRWARQISRYSLGLYLLLSPLFAMGMAAHPIALVPLWGLFVLAAPGVYVAARVATEQALLQARGHVYLAVWCSILLSGVSLLTALASLWVGGIALVVAGMSAGALLEFYVTRHLVTKLEKKALTSKGATAHRKKGVSVRLDRVPWPGYLVLLLSTAGVLMSSFFDQVLLARMGPGVQAAFGLASRPPAFLVASVLGAGSVMVTLLLAKRNAYTTPLFHKRVLELSALMLGLSATVLGLAWAGAHPLVQALYQRGSFSNADTLRVLAVMPYAIGAYLLYPSCTVLMRAVALESGARGLLVASGVYLGAKVLIGAATYRALGPASLALSSVLASLAMCSVLWHALTRRTPGTAG